MTIKNYIIAVLVFLLGAVVSAAEVRGVEIESSDHRAVEHVDLGQPPGVLAGEQQIRAARVVVSVVHAGAGRHRKRTGELHGVPLIWPY